MPLPPLAYLITFNCYGQWLHGDPRGSVDNDHNEYGEPLLPADRARQIRAKARMREPVFQLDVAGRGIALGAIREVCEHRAWRLWAAHVRSCHVHVVLTADAPPERVMNDLKAYASRALNKLEPSKGECKRWARHGSTRYIFEETHLRRAIHYVLFKQGIAQAVFDGRGTSPGGAP